MVAPPDIDGLPPADPKDLLLRLLEQNSEQRRVIAALRDEIARLKGLKGQPSIEQPRGMESPPVWSVKGYRIRRDRHPDEPLPRDKVPLGRQLRVIRFPQGQQECFRCPAPFETGPLGRLRSV